MTIAHSKLGASSMYRWEACPGSVALCVGIPSKTSPAAAEGSRVHDLCARALLGEDPYCFEYKGVGTEELDAVTLYYDTIAKDRKLGDVLLVERKLSLERVYPGCFGTADAIIFDPEQSLLRVYDFKYGKGHVSEENNSQLLYYALGAAIALGEGFAEFENVIIQPRSSTKSGSVRRQRLASIELLDFGARLETAAQRTEAPKAPLVAGRHCFFCPASSICPEQKRLKLEKAVKEFTDL